MTVQITAFKKPESEQQKASQERPIRLYSALTNGKWVRAEDTTIEGEDKKQQGSLRNIQALLTDSLTSTNLVVLAGLGTSLCLKDDRGEAIAPTMKALWTEVKGTQGVDIEKIRGLVNHSGEENIEILLSKCKMALEFWPDEQKGWSDVEQFVKTAEGVIKDKCNFVQTSTNLPVHQNFLRKIARRSSRKPRSRVFTTNYDRCFEAAAANARFVIVDGFSHAIPQSYDPIYFGYDIVRRDHGGESPDFIESVFHLYKLHGSVDWTKDGVEIVRKQNPDKPLLIYPRSSKYQQSFETPYIDMMAAFQSSIRQTETTLLVVGFGFNDDHISGPIMSALQANLNLRVVVIDPYFYQNENDEHDLEIFELEKLYHKKMEKLITEGDSRIAFISATFEGFVDVLPDLVAETDRERHAERFRKMRDYEENSK